ncbi:DUF1289 domain-containing protein [Methylophaga sp.]|uniref:DUF1289 domain-containing protein n=1 Tax=Methylophaga sp. TaxID=2024840 RepID=UPI003F6A2DD9
MSQENEVPSPCIRKCGLDEREICRGCFRSIDEIISWEAMNNQARLLTVEKCQKRRARRAARKHS